MELFLPYFLSSAVLLIEYVKSSSPPVPRASASSNPLEPARGV